MTTSVATTGQRLQRVRRRATSTRHDIAQFLVSQGVGQFADAMIAVLLAPMILLSGNGSVDPRQLLTTIGAVAVPYALVGPLAGHVADRWPRRRLLALAQLGRGVAAAVVPVAAATDSTPLALGCAAATVSCARLSFNLRAASLPEIAGERLIEIDARSMIVGMTSSVAGGGLATLVALPTLDVTLLIVALQLVSAAGFATLRTDLGGRRRDQPSFDHRDLVAALAAPASRAAIVCTGVHRTLLGATFVTFVLAASDRLGVDGGAYIIALAVTGVGTFVGTLLAPLSWRRQSGVGIAAAASLVPAVGLSASAHLGSAPALAVSVWATFLMFQRLRVGADAVMQRTVCPVQRAGAFSIYDASYNLAYFAGAAMAISLDASESPWSAMAVIGLLYAASTAVVAAVHRTESFSLLAARSHVSSPVHQ